MPMLLYGNGMISGATSFPTAASFGSNLTVTGYANVTQGLTTVSRGINNTSVPSGSVIQMVHSNTYCNESTTTDGLVTASVNISITPYFATSKIFIFFDILIYTGGTGGRGFRTAIARKIGSGSSTQISGSGFNGVSGHNISAYSGGWNENHHRVPWTYIDAPNTTQQVTYYPMYGAYSGGTTAHLGNGGNQYATFTLWEIAQ